MSSSPVHVIGAGLCGSEAAWQLAQRGIHVILWEMRPKVLTPVHQTGDCAELVCSNSFRSDDATSNAIGVLHEEMRRAGSLILSMADRHRLPAGGALAVDRGGFSQAVTEALASHPLITVKTAEVTDFSALEGTQVLVATGPLTSPALGSTLLGLTQEEGLAFFDAIAPIVYTDSIDTTIAWKQSRYDKQGPAGTGSDYWNCPMDKAQYLTFVQALCDGEKVDFKAFEKNTPYFEGCLPIEVMAERGAETLRHGPLKPRGLTNAHRPDVKPYAVVQLRQDNLYGTLYNLVGFQTKLKYAEQVRIFKTIPGLEQARFARMGGMHRNTFLNSPKVLDDHLRLKTLPHVRCAGQLIGVEGYVESAAMGLLAGLMMAAEHTGRPFTPPPATTAHGALLLHVTGALGTPGGTFQPMNINFGLFPEVTLPPQENGKHLRGPLKHIARKQALCARALADFDTWITGDPKTPPPAR